MFSTAWLVVAIVLAVVVTTLLTGWVTFTITRLDRLHARVDAAEATLDAQLVRRAAALAQVAQSCASGRSAPAAKIGADRERFERYEQAASAALTASGALTAARPDRAAAGNHRDREVAENAVGRAVAELAALADAVPRAEAAELREACARVVIARRFYNDAVRDTRGLRARRLPRVLRLSGHRELPQFFDIDDAATFPEPDGPTSSREHP
ncbi:MAG: LemA family protein [Actinomycetia bacterium]|nr:LemA family protein [Actinomycetes bacterium]